MKFLLAILAFVLMLPVIVLFGIALGPVALLAVLLFCWALPALLIGGAWQRHA